MVVNDAKIVVNGYDCYKSGDNYYLKIYTENEEETKYKINIFADITANPSKATSVRDLELYSINQYVDNYYGTDDVAPIVDGTITIREEGVKFVVEFDCMDDNGHKIAGTFTCSGLEMYDSRN